MSRGRSTSNSLEPSAIATYGASVCCSDQCKMLKMKMLKMYAVSKPRQIWKCHTAGVDVHPAEFGTAMQGRKHLAGIEQAFVVKCAF